MTFIFQISVHTTMQSHVVISVFGLGDRIIVDNLFKGECNRKSKHVKGDCKNTSSGKIIFISKGDLKCEATCLINEDFWCDYNCTTLGEGGGKRYTGLNASTETGKGGEGRGERKIWTCAEPFKTLLMNWTSCSMVSIGSPGRKYCSLDVLRMITEGTVTSLENRKTQLLIFLTPPKPESAIIKVYH